MPLAGARLHLDAQRALKYVDENTIGVVAILGSTMDGSYEPVAEIEVVALRVTQLCRTAGRTPPPPVPW